MADLSRIARRACLPLVAIAAAMSCRDPSSPPLVARLETSVAPALEAAVGSLLVPAPSFVVRDAQGRIVAGAAVSVTVTEGGGTLTGAPRRTADGPTPVGVWTLGYRAGRNVLSIRVGSLPPLELVVNGMPAAPDALGAASGDGQTALAGDDVPQPLSVYVIDRFGNGIAGAEVLFTVASGQGTISTASLTTDVNGIAGGVQWRLGHRGGEQRLTVTSGALSASLHAFVGSDFAPEVRFFGETPNESIRASFAAAADRVRAAVVGDISEVGLQNFDLARCGAGVGTLSETVDDVLIYASVTPIDGPGRILGSAGPCLTRSVSNFTVIGVMRFDVDDLNALATTGRLDAVILHEMLHVVGVGTLWRTRDLLVGSGTPDPRFVGALGAVRCMAAGGAIACSDSRIPVENTGGAGTIEAHWRESVFDSEIMTGFAESTPAMPFSAMTIASLEDLGLAPNYRAADPYFLPGTLPRLAPGGAALPVPAPWERLEFPRFDVTPGGWVRPVPWK